MVALGKKVGASLPTAGSATTASPVTKAINAPAPKEFVLPTVASIPIQRIEQCKTLIYGERKIGKTSLASQFQRPLFFMFEPGGDGLRIMKVETATWADFRGYAEVMLKSSREQYQTAVIDTADIAYERCTSYIAAKNNVKNISDVPYGGGYKLVRDEFSSWIDRLIRAKIGIVFTSHAQTTEFQGRTGENYNKIIPSMSKQAATYVLGLADIIAYYGYFGTQRLLTLQGSDNVEAGCRLAENFLIKGTTQMVHSIPMSSPDGEDFRQKEAYEMLIRAFNNEQEESGEPDIEAILETRAPKIMRTRS